MGPPAANSAFKGVDRELTSYAPGCSSITDDINAKGMQTGNRDVGFGVAKLRAQGFLHHVLHVAECASGDLQGAHFRQSNLTGAVNYANQPLRNPAPEINC